MINVRQLCKTHGAGNAAVKALKEVSFSIEQGEMVSIMGASGSGKTTLLQVLSGIDRMDSGEIWIGGTPIHELKDNQLSEFRLKHMGFIFQSYHLIPVLSAAENVVVPLLARGETRKAAKEKAAMALQQVGLGDKLDRLPSELSGGQNQRVAIARAIAGKPSVIWADEPTGALDSESSAQIIGLLSMLNQSLNTTVVIVTHDPNVAKATSRTIVMSNGRVMGGAGQEAGAFRHA
ncbi:ABC transporter ATP-binding protein [Paenibacillus sp. MMS18-CY102]|uniref:ABC transporter ATP-binding protein n=1 Tax=Paenibacillus sp. MMS18-CY102 TaxID=2682849 RepID=UPI001365B990|nr:ABC transporter ATP-binding protein [Paenibacillus sp. MMS18-CY102]MWC30166.1 ATP-binding cassette domain-containing protein [Paenibacillus sp. MMS18-CY102]